MTTMTEHNYDNVNNNEDHDKNKTEETTSSSTSDHDSMTLEEREEWLKSRGVLIETPADRKKAAATATAASVQYGILEQMMNSRMTHEDDSGAFALSLSVPSISFVCIPHDDSQPLRTLHCPQLQQQTDDEPFVGDALPNFCKPYFAGGPAIDANLLKEQATKQFALSSSSSPTGGDTNESNSVSSKITTAAMNAVAAQGSVETFPLVRPADTNQYTGVYIYLDEMGLLKKLPLNRRASSIAQACGYHPPPNFYGTVFVGRVQTKPTLHNVPFDVTDCSAGAEWMLRAVSENLAWQQEMNKITGKSSQLKQQLQPGQLGTDGKAAVEESFEWTQDEEEVEIVVDANEMMMNNKKDIQLSFHPKSIRISYQKNLKLTIGPLYGSIDVDGCTWTLDKNKLIITCEKSKNGEIWPRIGH
jgi:hypothetical protein